MYTLYGYCSSFRFLLKHNDSKDLFVLTSWLRLLCIVIPDTSSRFTIATLGTVFLAERKKDGKSEFLNESVMRSFF